MLDWRRWRELESQYGLGAPQAMMQRAVEKGDLAAGQPLEVLANVLLAAANEAVLFIAQVARAVSSSRVSHVRVLSVLTGRNRTLVP
jgi:hypothetical protein